MRTRMVRAGDGFPLAVQVSGADDARGAPVLLLLQGQANAHTWWAGIRAGFEQRFSVVTFDYRGTGSSRGPVGMWSTASFAADAADVLGALGVASAAVYGTSMGGRVAQLLAVEHPAVVRRLTLACTSPGGPSALERSTPVRRALSDPDPTRRLEAMRRLFYTDAWPGPATASRLFGDPTMTSAERQAHLRVSGRHDAWDRLPAIGVPTLVLHGADDEMVPTANAPLLAARIPGAQLQVHPVGRHGFFDEFSAELSPRVADFLDPR